MMVKYKTIKIIFDMSQLNIRFGLILSLMGGMLVGKTTTRLLSVRFLEENP